MVLPPLMPRLHSLLVKSEMCRVSHTFPFLHTTAPLSSSGESTRVPFSKTLYKTMNAGDRKDRAHAELQEHRSSIHDQFLVGTRPMVAPHDLKAVNPHAKNEEGAETPEELLDFIEMKGQDGSTPLQNPLSAFRLSEDRR